jgi:hypothetical protein
VTHPAAVAAAAAPAEILELRRTPIAATLRLPLLLLLLRVTSSKHQVTGLQ